MNLKDRILYYLDFQFLHLGLAKYLHQQFDHDAFAIIDANDKLKKTFKAQRFFQFKKIWHYRDNVINTDKQPDIQYLKTFEEKYNINIWKIAYAERAFNQYNDFYVFRDDEIKSILEQECRFFESILDEINPHFLLIFTSDWHHMHLLVQLCKARGIKVLMLVPVRLAGKMMIAEELDIIDSTVDFTENKLIKNRTMEELRDYLRKNNASKTTAMLKDKVYSSTLKSLEAGLEFFFTPGNKTYRKHYTNYGKTRLNAIMYGLTFGFKKRFREFFLNKNCSKKIDVDSKFVYFPLHFEPERVLLIGAPFHTNQIEIIKNIAKSLPIDYKLLVKEHPAMKLAGWRKPFYYKEIIKLPNVKLIHPSVDNEEIIKKCSMIISVSGTSGMEAAFYEKPAIIFSEFWGSSLLSSVYKIDRVEDLPQIIKKQMACKIDPSDLNKLINVIERNSFQFDFTSYFVEVMNRFYYGGALIDVKVPISQLEKFLDEYKDVYELLAKEHLNKINQYKKIEAKVDPVN